MHKLHRVVGLDVRSVILPKVNRDDRKAISLVLGSGGARGLTHIGVIRALEEHDYEISYISGSSIGALVGGIRAAGKLDDYADWVSALGKRDVLKLLDWSFSKGALISGNRIIEVLRDMVGEHAIEDLDIGFTAVATDIVGRREVWLNKGPLFDAIQASIAMPLIFAPVNRDGVTLVDGGLVNPIPIAPTLNDDTALTIAVDLNARPESLEATRRSDDSEVESGGSLRESITRFVQQLIPDGTEPDKAELGAYEIALNSFDTMQSTISRMKLAAFAPPVVIEIPRNLSTLFEFYRAQELIDFGYRRANDAIERIDERETY
jgi:NTE family protein